MSIRTIQFLTLFIIGFLFSQSTVYRVQNTDFGSDIKDGRDQLTGNGQYFFVYRLVLKNGPQINRNGMSFCISENGVERDDYDKTQDDDNQIYLSDLNGSSEKEMLRYRAKAKKDSLHNYFFIFEFKEDKFIQFSISMGWDSFDFHGNEIIFSRNTGIKKSFDFVADIFTDIEDDDEREDLVFPIYLHKELEAARASLYTAAGDEDYPETAEQAVFWIGNLGDEQAFYFLRKLYQESNNDNIREKVIFAYSSIGSIEATSELIAIAQNDENRQMRKKALFWLGQKASKKIAKLLNNIVEKDDDVEIKKSAVFALAQNENKESINYLMDIAIHNPSRAVRKSAIFWLSQSDSPEATQFLIDIVKRD